jgi:hypothetical protein
MREKDWRAMESLQQWNRSWKRYTIVLTCIECPYIGHVELQAILKRFEAHLLMGP